MAKFMLLDKSNAYTKDMVPTIEEFGELVSYGMDRNTKRFTWLRRYLSARTAAPPTHKYEIDLANSSLETMDYLAESGVLCLEQLLKVASITESRYHAAAHPMHMDFGRYRKELSNSRALNDPSVDILIGSRITNSSPIMTIAAFEAMSTCVKEGATLTDSLAMLGLMCDLMSYLDEVANGNPAEWVIRSKDEYVEDLKDIESGDRFIAHVDFLHNEIHIEGILTEGTYVPGARDDSEYDPRLTYEDLRALEETVLKDFKFTYVPGKDTIVEVNDEGEFNFRRLGKLSD